MQPISLRRPDDVYIVGFPKSGHTWMQYLIAGLVARVDVARCTDALVQDLVPDVEFRLAYRRYTEPMFFKSHALPQKDYRRVIYLLRDGRDAMVSYWHYYNALYPSMDFETLVRKAPRLRARWHEHVEAWLSNPIGAEVLIVRYEKLRLDPTGELRRIADFVSIEAGEEHLGKVAHEADFCRQQEREKLRGWENEQWPRDKQFLRRGAVGSFRDEMPADSLALFLEEAGPTLDRLGYLDSDTTDGARF